MWFSIRKITGLSITFRPRENEGEGDHPKDGAMPIHPFLNFAALNRAAMDPTSLITALLGAQTGMLQLAVAARLERMNVPGTASSVSQLITTADESADSLANLAAGVGANLDVTA